MTSATQSTLTPNKEFSRLATDEQIERVAKALEANGIHTLIAENGGELVKRQCFNGRNEDHH